MRNEKLNKYLKIYYLIEFGIIEWDDDFVQTLGLSGIESNIYLVDIQYIYDEILGELKSNLWITTQSEKEIIVKYYFNSILEMLIQINFYRNKIFLTYNREFNYRENFVHSFFDDFIVFLIELMDDYNISFKKIFIELEFDKKSIILENNDFLAKHFLKDISESPINKTDYFPFISQKAFSFFLELHSVLKKSTSTHSDYSFLYHKLKKDNFLLENSTQNDFSDFIVLEKYNIELNAKLKSFPYSTTFHKEALYTSIKELFFLKNN